MSIHDSSASTFPLLSDGTAPISSENDILIEVYVNELTDISKKNLKASAKSFLELDAMHISTWLPELNKCHAIEEQIDDLIEKVIFFFSM